MKKLLLCMFTLALLAPTKLMAAKENKFYNITVDGKARKYLLYVPNKVKENAPVVFSLARCWRPCLHITTPTSAQRGR